MLYYNFEIFYKYILIIAYLANKRFKAKNIKIKTNNV